MNKSDSTTKKLIVNASDIDLEQRSRVLSQHIFADSIRAAKEKPSVKSEPATNSVEKSLDISMPGALWSGPKQLSLDLKLEGNDENGKALTIEFREAEEDRQNENETIDPTISAWLGTIASIVSEIARRENNKRGEK